MSSTSQCQSISNITYGYGYLMISNSQFFVLGVDSSSKNMQMYKITFLSISVDWAKEIVCSSVSWISTLSESVLSSDRSTIYSFFIFGSPTYVYFAGLSVSDGRVTTARYKSSVAANYVFGGVLNGDYVVTLK